VPDFRFELPECAPQARESLRAELGVGDALAQVLVRRGHDTPAAAEAFLRAEETHAWRAMAGIEEAAANVLEHVQRGTRITVHGDYDVDGVCSTAVLVRVLRALGADVDSYLPDRAADGYGLAAATVGRLAARGTGLLITADCAITAVEEVALARSLGIDVVVTDHHSPRGDGVLPRAPLVHPAVCGYPCQELCATAVAHKFGEALAALAADVRATGEPASAGPAGAGALAPGRVHAAERVLREDLDLVALATVADLVPLRGENRTLVRQGLRALAATAKPGLRALMAVAGVSASSVDERALGFALAPRLNAAGRLYRADAGLELILTEDGARAGEIARELDAANSERRQVELGIRYEAEAQLEALGERAAYVIAGEGWHAGVIGIVASRLVERSGRPVVLLALDGDRARGSGRSIEGYDLLAGLRACAPHLERFGGHRAAAGVELASAAVHGFAAALAEHAHCALSGLDLLPVERVDALIGGAELTMALAEELARLAPFGRANPPVSLMVKRAAFADVRPMGEGRHVRFTLRSPGARTRAVAFGNGGRLPVAEGEPVAATFSLEVNEWNGVSEPRLVLRRAALARKREPAADAARCAPAQPLAQPAPDAGGQPPPAGREELQGSAPERGRPHQSPEGELVLFGA
jgi:single-stranded-DNA-specific exonuclease